MNKHLPGSCPPAADAAAGARASAARSTRNPVVVGAALALPFLFPFAAGPSANVLQQLATWTCLALAVALGPMARLRPGLAGWLRVVFLALLLGHGSQPALGLSSALAVAAVGLAACLGAGLAKAEAPAALPCALLVAGLLNAVLGLLQYYGVAETLVPWTTAAELGQAYGTLRQRNQFATLISMALISALWLHAVSGRRMRAALLPAAVLLLAAAAAATSRTGLLQLLLIAGISALLAWRERRYACRSETRRLPHPWLILSVVPAYFAISWLLPQLVGSEVEGMMARLRDGAPAAHSRLVLWRNVVELIAQHPWFGWGWGELKFAHYSTLYAGPRFVEILDNAHNLPLHLAVELGLPLALLICGGFCWLVLAAHPWRETDPARWMAWGLLGAIVLHSLLEYPLWFGPFQLVFGLCLGFLWPAVSAARRAAAPLPWRAARALPVAAALSLLAAVGYAGWDYTRISQVYLARDQRLAAYHDGTLEQARRSWLFEAPVAFARLTLTPVTDANAAEMHALARQVLHFSAEPAVIVKLIDSAKRLGRKEEARAQDARFRAAFPAEYARWSLGEEPEEGQAE
ncbi:PglL family O-oligosaccharyltransferase [Variovorax saccharolyticus]|uniref:PglL family O-oligosaccharyltransferase n=1 Tax=Variovorax saccharolyticus TaxID=3053516 RepID=UPI0025775528|nr:Wzy polymerase domain-containing protein [Variovorax sp. J31P216]MDM0027645.1 Wzy polymerase domain-containing protein [Variovorax sp. J31P216]